MRRLDRYLARSFLLGLIPVALLLAGLFSFLVLTEQLDDVGKGGFTTWAALKVTALMLPAQVLGMLPVITLLGALTGLGGLANHQEITASRAAGRSPVQLAMPVLLAATLVIGLAFLLQSYAVPQWQRTALQLRTAVTQVDLDGSDYDFWTRTGGRLLRVGEVVRGRVPTDIEIYQLDDRDRVVSLIRAARADIVKGDDWLLHDINETTLDGDRASTIQQAQRHWRSFLSQVQLNTLIQTPDTLSPADLLDHIASLERNHLDTHPFRLAFWQMVGLPIGVLAMALLAVPFVLGSMRSVPLGQRIALGGGIGMVFYLTEQIVNHLALLYELNPPLAALGPELIVLVIAWRRLRRAS